MQVISNNFKQGTFPIQSHITDITIRSLYLTVISFPLHKQFYKVVQIWPGMIVCKLVTVCPGHIWTTLYAHSWDF